MEKIYASAFILLPLFISAQKIAFTNKIKPAQFSKMEGQVSPADDRVSPHDITRNIGRQITFCGKVFSAKHTKDKGGFQTVFYIGGKYANELVDVKISLDDGYDFPDEIVRIISLKNLCLTGTVLEDSVSATIHLDSNYMRNLLNEAEQTPRDEKVEIMNGKELKVISNAYVLTGPRWKDPVITFLKAGSVIVAEQFRGNWALVRVIEKNGENVEDEEIVGYMNTKPLGLGSDGVFLVPR